MTEDQHWISLLAQCHILGVTITFPDPFVVLFSWEESGWKYTLQCPSRDFYPVLVSMLGRKK